MQTQIEKVFNRKKELIKRDPLFDELSKTFKKGIDIGIHFGKMEVCLTMRIL